MSELRTNRIVPRDGLPSGTFGGIIQVVQTVKQAEQTIDGTEADVISATINLKHASSKVMICWAINVGRGDDDYGYLKLFEGDSEITVSGHTDDVPLIFGSRYRDNWDLAAARSASVVQSLSSDDLLSLIHI